MRGIRNFDSDDNARDIAWKKSTSSDRIFTKEHESEGSTNVFFGTIGTDGFEFSTENYPISKKDFIENLKHSIEKSSAFFHFPLFLLENDTLKKLSAKKPKNSIILIVSSSLDTNVWKDLEYFSKQNDVILLHLFHPFEINPSEEDIILESKKIDTKKYGEEFWKLQEDTHNYGQKRWISIVELQTNEDPVLALNFYFKHRYAR